MAKGDKVYHWERPFDKEASEYTFSFLKQGKITLEQMEKTYMINIIGCLLFVSIRCPLSHL